jgi:sugar lactone lactonase YvrE
MAISPYMYKTLSLLVLLSVGAAPASSVRGVSVPRHAVKGAPWHVVVAVSLPGRATLRATGPETLSVPLRMTKQRGRYGATLRFPFAGSWRIAVTAGRRTAHLGSVVVDAARDPLVRDPFTIAAEPSGSLVVGQLRAAPLLRIAHARAQKLADGPGVFHVSVEGGKTYAAGRDGVVYRLDGSTLTPLTPPMDADAVAVDGAGNLYVALYAGWIKKVAPDGTVTNVAGNGTEGYTGDGGPATAAQLFHPHSIAIGKDGALYIADTENRHIRRVDLTTGCITTFGGDVGITVSLAVGPDGSIYSADVVRDGTGGGVTRTSPAGVTRRILSSATANGVAVAPGGAVYVNLWEPKRIQLLTAAGKLVPVVRG